MPRNLMDSAIQTPREARKAERADFEPWLVLAAEVEPLADVAVVTFSPSVAGGEPARAFYQKMGFSPAEMSGTASGEPSRQVFRRPLPGRPA